MSKDSRIGEGDFRRRLPRFLRGDGEEPGADRPPRARGERYPERLIATTGR